MTPHRRERSSPTRCAPATGARSRAAITLVESTRADHRDDADALLDELLPAHRRRGPRRHHAARPARASRRSSRRSAMHLVDARPPGRGARGRPVEHAHRRLDPRRQDPHGASSPRSPDAFIRPSPSGRHARRRRPPHPRGDAAVRGRRLRRRARRDGRRRPVRGRGRRHGRPASCCCVAPGGGDELQGIKRGIVELADLVVVNKADGDLAAAAAHTAADYAAALHLVRPRITGWDPRVLTVLGAARAGHRRGVGRGRRVPGRGRPRAPGDAGGPEPRLDVVRGHRLAARHARRRRTDGRAGPEARGRREPTAPSPRLRPPAPWSTPCSARATPDREPSRPPQGRGP